MGYEAQTEVTEGSTDFPRASPLGCAKRLLDNAPWLAPGQPGP